MKIQILGLEKKNYTAPYDMVFNHLSSPQNFSDFDVNIIDLQYRDMWDCFIEQSGIRNWNDLQSIKNIIPFHNKKVIVIFPMNYYYNYQGSLKNQTKKLTDALTKIIVESRHNKLQLLYENTKTVCANSTFEASFSFEGPLIKTLTQATGNRATSISWSKNCILTTLNLFQENTNLQDYFIAVGLDECKKTPMPKWAEEIEYFDDREQKNIVQDSNNKIQQLKAKIINAEEKLEKNNYYKSILYESGNNLVKVVFDILEKILNCDLSDFKDKFQEDFAIKLDDITFVGEIKGISSNVKSSNITQAVNHMTIYKDGLQESGTEENTKAILIVNSFRDRALSDREPIHDNQIKEANLYSCLIILTKDLLTLFEMFESSLVNVEKIRQNFKEQIGVFNIDLLK